MVIEDIAQQIKVEGLFLLRADGLETDHAHFDGCLLHRHHLMVREGLYGKVQVGAEAFGLHCQFRIHAVAFVVQLSDGPF